MRAQLRAKTVLWQLEAFQIGSCNCMGTGLKVSGSPCIKGVILWSLLALSWGTLGLVSDPRNAVSADK